MPRRCPEEAQGHRRDLTTSLKAVVPGLPARQRVLGTTPEVRWRRRLTGGRDSLPLGGAKNTVPVQFSSRTRGVAHFLAQVCWEAKACGGHVGVSKGWAGYMILGPHHVQVQDAERKTNHLKTLGKKGASRDGQDSQEGRSCFQGLQSS